MRVASKSVALLLGLLVAVAAASCSSGSVYTLYRDSATQNGTALRIHVATFDSADGEAYNRENCEVARKVFSGQEGVTVKYWCEKGRYKP
jgi:hypothetical protein